MNIFILRFPYECMNQIHACFFSYELRAYPTYMDDIHALPARIIPASYLRELPLFYLHKLRPYLACANCPHILLAIYGIP